ncbi:unnamed protein product [Brachionus calyciflorus]|uniref:Uncharacterized protein n=1 Tax=Brachionus calyciflorus TaxID=104777 RepID=A0A814KH90_9BILA|nr:unnamed protein product [Brachionus calyciflorus]
MSLYDYALCLADIERRKTTRQAVYNYFLKFSTRLVVAQEYHMNMYTVHFHIYIQSQNEVKDVKDQEINRLKEKYKNVLSGRLEMNHQKIMNFVSLIIPVLTEQFKDQSDVRYNCLFSNCNIENRSYVSKQKFIQHLCQKHGHQLPDQGIFLLNGDSNFRFGGFDCEKCVRNFTRKDHFKNIDCKKNQKSNEDCLSEVVNDVERSPNRQKKMKLKLKLYVLMIALKF